MSSRTLSYSILGAVIAFQAVAYAQQQGQAPVQQAPSPAPSTPSPGAGAPGRQPGIPTQPGQQQPGRFPTDPSQNQGQFPEMQRMFFFSGKVVLDDGTPPPDSVQIERVCNGVPKPEAWTDSKGRFSFQLGQNTAMMADASTNMSDGVFGGGGRSGMPGMGGGRQITERDLMGCELRAALPGFRSDVFSLAGRRSMDSPEIGTLVLHRLAKVDGFTFSATSAFAPKDARKAYEKGVDLRKKKKIEPAEKELQKAVTSYPKYAAAWYELGMIYQSQSKLDEARNAYEQAIKADEKFITPYAQLSRITAGQAKWEEAANFSSRVIKLNPFFSPEVYFLNGVANLNLKKLPEAEESTKEALKLDPKHQNPRVLALMGLIHAQKGEFKQATEALKEYLAVAPQAPDADRIKGQIEQIEKEMARENPAGRENQAQ